MTYIKAIKNILKVILAASVIIILIINQKTAKSSAISGLLLAGNVIIPTLFPFLVSTIIIYKKRLLDVLPFPKRYGEIKGHFIVFLLSNLGGYPIGAKLISEKYNNKEILKRDAELLLLCSINSGPAFSILAVGGGILNSTKLGIIIYISQLISSFLMFLFLSKNFSRENFSSEYERSSFIDIFVSAVSDSSAAMLNICGYIVVCSTALGILNSYNLPNFLKTPLNLTLEISNGILYTKNIYVLVIVLTFSGFSIIFQVLSICKAFSPSFLKILLSRLIHSVISVAFSYLLLKIFPVNIETVGNLSNGITLSNNSIILTCLLLLTVITLIYSVSSKKYCGKISADIF